MTFDREALRGIYNALSPAERTEIVKECNKLNNKLNIERGRDGTAPDRHLWIIQKVMVDLGHISEFHISSCEVAAQEYDEILLAQELMGE